MNIDTLKKIFVFLVIDVTGQKNTIHTLMLPPKMSSEVYTDPGLYFEFKLILLT